MSEKTALFISIWNKYLPVIRILLKKSVTADQALNINRTDVDRAVGSKKSGYRFYIQLVNNSSNNILNADNFTKSFIAALQSDEAIKQLLSENNYTFTFTSKYQLQIKNNGLLEPQELSGEEQNQ